jgi:diguanylate cyclase (GGDEF)-like protein
MIRLQYLLGDGDMSADQFVGDERIRDDNIGDLLAGAVRLLSGAVAAAFVPKFTTDTPVVWANLDHADVAVGLSALAGERLSDNGPWGAVTLPTWTAWVEPVLGYDGTEPAEPGETAPAGVLAIAFRDRAELTAHEIDTARLLARLCASISRARDPTSELAHQRRVDDLVSTISERLMSTTFPTLQDDLDWTIETLCSFLMADAAFLRRNDHAGGMSVMLAEYPSRGLPLEEDPLGIVPFEADPIFAATKDLKVPLIVREALNDEDYQARLREGTGVATFTGAAVPLVHADNTEGLLAFIYLTDFNWSEHEVNALRAVAAILVQLLHRVDAEERLRRSALTDDLTGLPNRRALLEEVTNRQQSGNPSLALLFIDLDRFKVMNDHLGHGAGDKVLHVIADRIRTSLRPTDFAARLGGDEFVVVLEDTGGGLGAVAAANRLLDLISLPIEVGGQRVAHTGSVGIAISEHSTITGEELLGQADIALYAAKSQGRNRTVVFDHHLEATVAQRSSIELLLRQALSERALRVLYQPEFDLRNGRLLAVEALVRWERPGYGLVEAGQFVPVAEETHLITDIDRWVLEEACIQLASWRRAFPGIDLVMRVNMSPAQLAVAGIVRSVADCLRHSGLAPQMLCLEITEQAVIADVDQAVRVLHDIRAMGVKLALDDFGTGFSSMSQLKTLPVDLLKIDRVFVDSISKDPTDQAIVETIVRLARAFKLDVVGEGVETMADLQTLVRLGCDRAQGYLLSHPLPPDELVPLLVRGAIDLRELGAPVGVGGTRLAKSPLNGSRSEK